MTPFETTDAPSQSATPATCRLKHLALRYGSKASDGSDLGNLKTAPTLVLIVSVCSEELWRLTSAARPVTESVYELDTYKPKPPAVLE